MYSEQVNGEIFNVADFDENNIRLNIQTTLFEGTCSQVLRSTSVDS